MLTSLGERKEPQDRCAQKISIDSHKEYAHIKKWPPKCPQSDVVDPGVGNFVINGVKLDIPRKYLVGTSRGESDGIALGAQINFVYPDMRDYTAAKEEKKYNISILLQDSNVTDGSSTVCNPEYPDWCYPRARIPYRVRVASGVYRSEEEFYKALPKEDEIEFKENLNLYRFIANNHRLKHEVYFKGSIRNPDFYLICNQHSCTSYQYLQNYSLTIQYSFVKKHLLPFYKGINKKIMEKNNSFIKKEQ